MDDEWGRLDAAVLALLWLGLHDDGRAWQGHEWDGMDRLPQKGVISTPRREATSVAFTEEGLEPSRRLLDQVFARTPGSPPSSH